MSAGPPRPRPFRAGDTATTADDDTRRLTAPEAYALYCGAVGYRLPHHLNRALHLSDALRKLR